MSWIIEGIGTENCSCPHFCVYNLGATGADGWHAGSCVYRIEKGVSEGIDLSGTAAIMTYHMTGSFADARATGRVYIGDNATPEQYRELDAIFNGRRGGSFVFTIDTFSTHLPTKRVPIEVGDTDPPTVRIGDIAEVKIRRLTNSKGQPAKLKDAIYLEAVGIDHEELCDATGSHWSDPEMPKWRSGGGGGIVRFRLTSEQSA